MHRIGVFVCHCGTNIAATVDVKQVAEAMKQEPGVVFSTDYQYMCSEGGQNNDPGYYQGSEAHRRCCLLMFTPYARGYIQKGCR